MDVILSLIEKIRKSVKYIGFSVYRNQKFTLALSHTRLSDNKKVSLDTETRWNSTYMMLESALQVRDAFDRLGDLDPEYKDAPSNEDWEMGTKICNCLKIFYKITNRLSGTKYPTANYYFKDIIRINVYIDSWKDHEDGRIRAMALLMESKFNKYWSLCGVCLTIGLVLDLRYKMDFVELGYEEIYGNSYSTELLKFQNKLKEIFNSYQVEVATTTTEEKEGNPTSNALICTLDDDDDDKLNEKWSSRAEDRRKIVGNSLDELENYLKEPLLHGREDDPTSFDILNYWNHDGLKYPTLRKMARDILAIPVSTVASESAFSWGRRIIEDSRSSLKSDTVKALLCTKDWLPTITTFRVPMENSESKGKTIETES